MELVGGPLIHLFDEELRFSSMIAMIPSYGDVQYALLSLDPNDRPMPKFRHLYLSDTTSSFLVLPPGRVFSKCRSPIPGQIWSWIRIGSLRLSYPDLTLRPALTEPNIDGVVEFFALKRFQAYQW